MVTQRQRVAVTLSDETRELVHRLAELQETSASKVVAGIVAGAVLLLIASGAPGFNAVEGGFAEVNEAGLTVLAERIAG